MDEGRKILIVEDEVIISMRLEMFFKRRGYKILAAVATGKEAVRNAIEKKPDIILMDINLRGDMSGLEAAEKIHEHHKVPIIFVTGYSDDEFKTRAGKLDPIGYFMKPINMYEIISALNKFEEDV